jgi:hypothetical protein
LIKIIRPRPFIIHKSPETAQQKGMSDKDILIYDYPPDTPQKFTMLSNKTD